MGQKGPNGKRRVGCGCQLLPRRVNRRVRAVEAAKLEELRWRDLEPGQGRCYARAVLRNIWRITTKIIGKLSSVR